MNGNQSTVVIRLTFKTKKLLDTLKYNDSETYDSVISRLLYLEEKYNSTDLTQEYEICIDDESRLFRVDWNRDSYTIYYYDSHAHEWSGNIIVWENGLTSDVQLFVDALLSLVANDSFRALLLGMGKRLEFDGYSIRKL